jgi:hypothetical protein
MVIRFRVQKAEIVFYNFYAKLYSIPEGQEPAAENCIEDFLGPEICNSRLVMDSKIPEQKRLELEQDITIQELDISAAQGNKSAAVWTV